MAVDPERPLTSLCSAVAQRALATLEDEVLELRRIHVELDEHGERLRPQGNANPDLHGQTERRLADLVQKLARSTDVLILHAKLLLERDEPPANIGVSRPRARQRAELELRELVHEVIWALDGSARQHRVSLRAAVEADRVFADEDLLRRTLTGLVERAIRVAPAGTSIEISAKRRREGTVLRLVDVAAWAEPHHHGHSPCFGMITITASQGHLWIEDAAEGP